MCRKSVTVEEEPKVKVVEKLNAESAFKLAEGLRDRLISQGVLDETLCEIYESIQESAESGWYSTNYTFKDGNKRLLKDDLIATLEEQGYSVKYTDAGMFSIRGMYISWNPRDKNEVLEEQKKELFEILSKNMSSFVEEQKASPEAITSTVCDIIKAGYRKQ